MRGDEHVRQNETGCYAAAEVKERSCRCFSQQRYETDRRNKPEKKRHYCKAEPKQRSLYAEKHEEYKDRQVIQGNSFRKAGKEMNRLRMRMCPRCKNLSAIVTPAAPIGCGYVWIECCECGYMKKQQDPKQSEKRTSDKQKGI